MTTQDDIRIPYKPELYVPREKAEAEVKKWLAGNGRLLTITSPPATGKSWLLRHTEAYLQADTNSLAFWLDVRKFLISTPGPLVSTRTIDTDRQSEWLANFLAREKEICKDVPDYDPRVETAVLLERFAATIQHCYPNKNLYLLVEGGDEPNEATWRDIERQILEPIARIANWRFVIVLRQEQRLTSYILRRSQLDLKLGVLDTSSESISEKGRLQIQNLRSADEEKDLPSIDDIMSAVPGYTWTHPGLNHFLFLEIKANRFLDKKNWLTSDYRIKALSAITMLPDSQVDELYNWLTELAIHLDKQSIIEAWSRQTGLAISVLWQRLDALQNAQLIKLVPPNRYSLPDGLREFIRGPRSIIDVRIDADYEEWQISSKNQQVFISELSERLSLNPKRIQLLTIKKGSVIITIEIDDDVANELVRSAQDGLFPEWRIISIVHNDLASYLTQNYNNDDLHQLCFRLKIIYEDLPGEIISRKAIEIIKYCERRGMLEVLIQECQYMRPHLPVPHVH